MRCFSLRPDLTLNLGFSKWRKHSMPSILQVGAPPSFSGFRGTLDNFECLYYVPFELRRPRFGIAVSDHRRLNFTNYTMHLPSAEIREGFGLRVSDIAFYFFLILPLDVIRTSKSVFGFRPSVVKLCCFFKRFSRCIPSSEVHGFKMLCLRYRSIWTSESEVSL